MIRDIIMGDLYVPRSYDDVAALVSPEVAAKLDPKENYGLWEWGAIKNTRTQVSVQTPEGRIYRTQQKRTLRPEGELCPMGIFFVRSKNGVSHNPHEWSSKEDCTAGANILYSQYSTWQVGLSSGRSSARSA